MSLTGPTVTKYYYLGSQRVAMRQGSSTVYFLLGDHLGSTSVTASSSGGKVAELRYHPWGGTRYSSGTTPTARRYTGQIEDAAIGLYFYNARYYDPALGRFLQADTIVPAPANPQSLNRYAYVLNNPLRYTDPSGHEPVTFTVIGLFALAGAAGSGIGYVAAQTALGNPIDPTELGVVIGTGAIAGALTPVASLAGLVGIGIGANVANEILPALIKGEPVDPVRTVIAGGIGGIFGLAGGVVGGGSDAVEQYLGRRAVQPLCEAIGPASAESGKGMLRRASEELVREGAREGARTAVSEFFSNINVDTLTQWFD